MEREDTNSRILDGEKLSYVLISKADKEVVVQLNSSNMGKVVPPSKKLVFSYFDLFDSNEEENKVAIRTDPIKMQEGVTAVTIPPNGLVVLAHEGM